MQCVLLGLTIQYSLTYKNPGYKNNACPFLKKVEGTPVKLFLELGGGEIFVFYKLQMSAINYKALQIT